MDIRPPENFIHAGQLRPAEADRDPREATFEADELIIDLRECYFVRPAAVLWCTVYPLLANQKSVPGELLVPENKGVAAYLETLGLFDVLKDAGITVDDRGIARHDDAKLVLPLTRFDSLGDVHRLANRAYEALAERGMGRPDVHRAVSEVFAELAMNAVEHAASPIGAFGFIQFYEFEHGERFVFGVADGGIGIRDSLAKNPEIQERIPYDWTAIEVAMGERVSGTGEPTRGIGLFGVKEEMREPGRQLVIHSGIGSLTINEELETFAKRETLFPGTLAYASITT